MITLSPGRVLELIDVLAAAIKPEELDSQLLDPLAVPQPRRSAARSFKQRLTAVIEWAIENDRVAELLRSARRANPYNEQIRVFDQAIGLRPETMALVELMRAALPSGDEKAWLRGLAEVRRHVCRVRVGQDDDMVGTGFLVGPDQVMTLYALVKPVIEQSTASWDGAEVAVAFPDEGDEANFENATLLKLEPAAPIVVAVQNGPIVLRLNRALGREIQSQEATTLARSRGWTTPPAQPPPQAPSPLVIVQSTVDGVGIAADPAGFLGAAPDGTLTYAVSTHPGSMGAPCFDAAWQFLGIHVSAGSRHNRGVSAQGVVAALRARGFAWSASTGVQEDAGAAPRPALPPIAMPSHGLPTEHRPLHRAGALDDVLAGIDLTPGEDDSVWSPDVEADDFPEAERWAWAEAAAVHATFEPEVLQPFGAASVSSRLPLMLESRAVPREDGTRRWVPSDVLRRRALERLAARGELLAARAVNPSDPSDVVDVVFGSLIAGTADRAAWREEPASLRAAVTATEWLHGLVTPLPDPAELRSTLERAMSIAPFRHLTRGFFAGRDEELARLTAYAHDRGVARGPMFIFGSGGMGKSALLAHFVLARADGSDPSPGAWRPFVYLDFDRPELDAKDPMTLLRAIVAQIGPQFPEVAPTAERLLTNWSRSTSHQREQRQVARKRRPTNVSSRRSRRDIAGARDEVVALLLQVPHAILLILDTLEEVQFSTPDAIEPLIELATDLAKAVPQLRPILAGRIEVADGVDSMELGPLTSAAAEALLSNELPAGLAQDAELVQRMVSVVGGNPLSLQLAAELLTREKDKPGTALAELGPELWRRIGDALVQGRLYERILGHIHTAPVLKLARPGLVLRRLTPELIRDVLAVPCDLGEVDDVEAQTLFDALAREVALVRLHSETRVLELRAELRRIVREDFARDEATMAKRMSIHRAAVEYYSARLSVVDRAEEIYHRLSLDQDPNEIDRRWIDGVEPLLRTTVAELPPRAAVYLTNRLGGVADEAALAAASPIDWEEWAAKRADDLLHFGAPARALDVLRSRPERLPGSRLHYFESIALRSLPEPDLEASAAAASRAVTAARTTGNSDELRTALEDLVQVRRLRDDSAGVLQALAELGDLGDQLGDDLIVLQADVEMLESAADPSAIGERFTVSAVRVFNRLPDDLVARAPELSRRVAAQVGGDDPATLQRVMRIVGTGSLDEAGAAGLQGVLRTWKHNEPGIATLIPHDKSDARELASAARFLVGNHRIEPVVAHAFADWLKTVVTPTRDPARVLVFRPKPEETDE